ncbi:hypothetical protein F383_03059 [Gossypium arboreum]|uniref:Uncharacterized protein n=1 Tax=Gossypium arboreum TaxID=29729 RepID=A0A0B0P1S2_GOSAR|nr:hypothetical protein F383_03059 [Gossypium arboreum]
MIKYHFIKLSQCSI